MMVSGRKRNASASLTGCMVFNSAASRVETSAPASSPGTGVRVALTTTFWVAVATRNCRASPPGEVASAVSGANPGAKTRTTYEPAPSPLNCAIPFPDVFCTATGDDDPERSSSTLAPGTTADWGSTTLTV